MGTQCSTMCTHQTIQDGQYKNEQVALVLTEQTKQVKIVADKISKSRVQAQFPNPPSHIQQRIQKLSKYQKYLLTLTPQLQLQNQKKIYRCKSPFNFVYMNLQDRQESYPIGKCIIYKLKQRDQFAGYFQGTLKENFIISPQDSIIVFSNGCYFEGISDNQGRYLNENTGLKYQGGWQNQMPSNLGKQKNNKGIYQGQYEKGQKQGKGRFVWNDGSVYEGNFQKGLFSGQGCLTDQNQKYIYKGEFKYGQKHGKGVQKTRKQTYSGQFQYGVRSGNGKVQIYEGENSSNISRIYEGQLYLNQLNGRGKLKIYEKGIIKQVISGIWTKNKLTCILQQQIIK